MIPARPLSPRRNWTHDSFTRPIDIAPDPESRQRLVSGSRRITTDRGGSSNRPRRDALPAAPGEQQQGLGDIRDELPPVDRETRHDYADPRDYGGIDETCQVDRCTYSLFGVGKLAGDVAVRRATPGVFRRQSTAGCGPEDRPATSPRGARRRAPDGCDAIRPGLS